MARTSFPTAPRTAPRERDAADTTSAATPRLEALLPLDGSELGLRALPYVAKLLDPARHHLTLLRVGTPPDPAPVPLPPPLKISGFPGHHLSEMDLELQQHPIYDSQLWESVRSELGADMGDEVARLREAGFDVDLEVRFGDPHGEILDAARERAADLIVMTTHGRSGLSRALAGSVTEAVLRRAPVPVLTIRP